MREPFIQTNKLRLGVFDTSLATFGSILPTGTLVNSGISFFGMTPQAGAARAVSYTHLTLPTTPYV